MDKKIVLPIQNFPAQRTIFDCQTRFIIVAKGRRFGFTRGAANDFILSAIKRQFTKGLWVDTVNANIERYFERYFMPALKKIPQQYWRWRKQEKILHLFDSYIDFRSADRPENLEGFGYDKALLNEAGIILKDLYLWNNAIKPMLWDYECKTIIGGAPKGKGVFYELYQRGEDPSQKDYTSFKFSSFDNPYIQQDVIRQDMKDMPERVVRQEIYAEFIDDNGTVFRNIEETCILEPEEQKDGEIYVIGCDLAKVQDFTVLTVYNRRTNNQVYQVRFNKIEWPFQKEKIKDLSRKYNNALVMLDATGIGDPIADDLLRAGVPVEPIKLTNESKKQIIEKLSNWIELGNCKMLNLEETKREFTNFTYDMTSQGRILYQAPLGFHDDIVISHALAVGGLQPIARIS